MRLRVAEGQRAPTRAWSAILSPVIERQYYDASSLRIRQHVGHDRPSIHLHDDRPQKDIGSAGVGEVRLITVWCEGRIGGRDLVGDGGKVRGRPSGVGRQYIQTCAV